MNENRPESKKDEVKVVLTPEDRDEVMSDSAPAAATPPPAGRQVRIAPNLLDVATGRVETQEEKEKAQEQHDLNEAVHFVLIVGLTISSALMIAGVIEGLVLGHPMPTVEPDLGQVVTMILQLRPTGLMGLGLLVLIATPILRVVGSIIAFAYERDWRYVGITTVVLAVVMASIVLGKG